MCPHAGGKDRGAWEEQPYQRWPAFQQRPVCCGRQSSRCWSITAQFLSKQVVNYTASGTIIWLRGAEKKTVREEGERQRGNANFCCLSPAAVLAVWHVWWMVLHWFCWPLTSAHCYQSRNKREEEKRRITQQAQGTPPFINAHTQEFTQRSYFPLLRTHACVQPHTRMHTQTLMLITCVLLQCVFAEQRLLPSAWLTSFLLAPPHTRTHKNTHTHTTTTTSIWCNNGTTVGKLLGAWIQTGTSSKLLIFCISREWKSGAVADECTPLNTWK